MDQPLLDVTFEHQWVFCRYPGCGWQREFEDLGLDQARAERTEHERECLHRFD